MSVIAICKSKEKPLYLLDQNTINYFGTRPSKLFLDLMDVLPIDSKDDDVLAYATNNNLIIVTRDVEFAVKILSQSKSVIFQGNDNKRFYLKVKESKKISIPRKTEIGKTFTQNSENKKSYVVDDTNLVSLLKEYSVKNPFTEMSRLEAFERQLRTCAIYDYAKKSKAVLITMSTKKSLNSLIELDESVLLNNDSSFSYVSVECFLFETVTHDKTRLTQKNYDNKDCDILQENIRFVRKNISEIVKTLNFVECELVRRNNLEASKETPSSRLSGYQKEANHE